MGKLLSRETFLEIDFVILIVLLLQKFNLVVFKWFSLIKAWVKILPNFFIELASELGVAL